MHALASQRCRSRAGSSMRLVRLKPQDPGHNRAWTARYNENLQSQTRSTLGPGISREKICGLLNVTRGWQSLSCLRARRDHDPAMCRSCYVRFSVIAGLTLISHADHWRGGRVSPALCLFVVLQDTSFSVYPHDISKNRCS